MEEKKPRLGRYPMGPTTKGLALLCSWLFSAVYSPLFLMFLLSWLFCEADVSVSDVFVQFTFLWSWLDVCVKLTVCVFVCSWLFCGVSMQLTGSKNGDVTLGGAAQSCEFGLNFHSHSHHLDYLAYLDFLHHHLSWISWLSSRPWKWATGPIWGQWW